jgi:hypothetical protein
VLLQFPSYICVLSSLPRRTLRVHLSLTSAKNGSLPQKNGGSAPHFPFRGLLDVHCTLRPAYSLSRLMRPFYIGGLAPAAFAPTPVPSVRSLASRTSARAWPHSSLVPSATCKLVYLRLLRLLPAGAKVGRVGFAPTGKSRLFTARVFQQNRPRAAIDRRSPVWFNAAVRGPHTHPRIILLCCAPRHPVPRMSSE